MSKRKKQYKEERWRYRNRINQLRREVGANEAANADTCTIYNAYIGLLLKRMGADEDHELEISREEISAALGCMEIKAGISEDGKMFTLHYEEAT